MCQADKTSVGHAAAAGELDLLQLSLMTQSERKLLGNEIQQEIHTINNCFTMAVSEMNHNWTTEK
jgi:hypothetical protein